MMRTRIAPVLRVLATAVMLAVILPRLRLSALLPDWKPENLAWLAGAVATTLAAVVLSAVRWQRVLAALDVPVRVGSLLSVSLAGQFVSNVLPSTIGGDVLRVSRLSSATSDSPASFASVVLERLTGWIVLPVLSLVGLALNPGLLRLGTASRVAVGVSLGTLLLLVGLLGSAASPRVLGRFAESEGWQRFVGAVHLGIERFKRRPVRAASVLGAGFAYQLLIVLAAFLATRALGIGVSGTAIIAFMPAVAMLQVLPVSVGGLGVREGAFVLFLSSSGLGATIDQAIALGLLLYLVNLVVSLLGAPAFAAGSRRPARVVA